MNMGSKLKKVHITYERSAALTASGIVPSDASFQEDGGAHEWVQLTYQELRIAPNGDTIATLNKNGLWERNDGALFTDIIIG